MASLIVALVVVESSRAQQNAPAAPTFRSRTDTVALDVVVLDRNGNPITNLDESEFEVFEDRVRRPITTFTVVNFADVATKPVFDDVETDVATNTEPEGRLFIIAWTRSPAISETRISSSRRAGSCATSSNESFGPNDVAAVVLVGRGSVQTGQDFTNSKRRLLQAIERYSGGGRLTIRTTR
jgi:VWFA-related protein